MAHQSHVCAPGCTVDESSAGRPPIQRNIYNTLVAYLRTIGPVHEDAVTVGVFRKNDHKLAEIRPMATGLSLALILRRKIDQSRVSRHVKVSADRFAHVVRLTSVEDVDNELREG